MATSLSMERLTLLSGCAVRKTCLVNMVYEGGWCKLLNVMVTR